MHFEAKRFQTNNSDTISSYLIGFKIRHSILGRLKKTLKTYLAFILQITAKNGFENHVFLFIFI